MDDWVFGTEAGPAFLPAFFKVSFSPPLFGAVPRTARPFFFEMDFGMRSALSLIAVFSFILLSACSVAPKLKDACSRADEVCRQAAQPEEGTVRIIHEDVRE